MPDGLGQALPARGFRLELRLAAAGQLVKLRFAPAVGALPVGRQPAALFEPVQRRVERSLRHLDDLPRHLVEPLRDGLSMNRAQRHDFEDEQIECALGKIGL